MRVVVTMTRRSNLVFDELTETTEANEVLLSHEFRVNVRFRDVFKLVWYGTWAVILVCLIFFPLMYIALGLFGIAALGF